MSPGMVQTFGSILWVLTLAGFALAGLALIVLPDQAILWLAPAVVGSVASLGLLAFFWHPWLVLGVVIDLGVLAALALGWPPAIFIH